MKKPDTANNYPISDDKLIKHAFPHKASKYSVIPSLSCYMYDNEGSLKHTKKKVLKYKDNALKYANVYSSTDTEWEVNSSYQIKLQTTNHIEWEGKI